MNTISILLPKTDYTGGETISGSVELTIEEALPARGVRVQFRGMEQSHWTEGSGKHRHVHSEERVLFDEEQTLWGRPPLGLAELLADSAKGFFSAGHYEVLEPGAWSLPFTFVLPQELPGDYISMAKSTIEYEVRAWVDIPLKVDLKTKQSLTIYEAYRGGEPAPVMVQDAKRFLFDSAGALDLSVALERQLFFVGETIQCRLHIQNASSKRVEKAILSLKQTEYLRAGDTGTEKECDLGSQEFPEAAVPAGGQGSFVLPFQVPADLYPTVSAGTLIKVRYELKVQLDIPWARDLELLAPILLLERVGVPGGCSGPAPATP